MYRVFEIARNKLSNSLDKKYLKRVSNNNFIHNNNQSFK